MASGAVIVAWRPRNVKPIGGPMLVLLTTISRKPDTGVSMVTCSGCSWVGPLPVSVVRNEPVVDATRSPVGIEVEVEVDVEDEVEDEDDVEVLVEKEVLVEDDEVVLDDDDELEVLVEVEVDGGTDDDVLVDDDDVVVEAGAVVVVVGSTSEQTSDTRRPVDTRRAQKEPTIVEAFPRRIVASGARMKP